MHKYWGKKPFNEISKFIEKYSDKNDTVLDCFCGSGVTIIEALRANRKAIGVDLNPIAIKLAKTSVTTVDEKIIQKTFDEISDNVKNKINSLYDFIYENELTHVTHIIWKDNFPIEVWYKKDGSKEKFIRVGCQKDIEMTNNPSIQALWYPTSEMFENTRINVNRGQKVDDLFTKRALVGLSLILNEINKIQDEKIREVFELTLTGTLSQASKLVFVIRDRKKSKETLESRAEVGSWVIGYWVPEEHFEINVWNCFENRFKRIKKGITEINSIFSNNNIENKVQFIEGSATKLSLKDNSIDYVFIDPPHTNRVLYMEQSLMWNSWLKLDNQIDWNKEIIVSEAKNRKTKNLDDYNNLMNETFVEIRRVLKKGKYFSFAFNSLDDKTWINILNLFNKNGFVIEDIQPLEYSATSVIQDNRKNSLKTDFVLTFRNERISTNPEVFFNLNIDELNEKINEILHKNPNFEVYNVMNALFELTIPEGYIYKVSDIVKQCAEIMG